MDQYWSTLVSLCPLTISFFTPRSCRYLSSLDPNPAPSIGWDGGMQTIETLVFRLTWVKKNQKVYSDPEISDRVALLTCKCFLNWICIIITARTLAHTHICTHTHTHLHTNLRTHSHALTSTCSVGGETKKPSSKNPNAKNKNFCSCYVGRDSFCVSSPVVVWLDTVSVCRDTHTAFMDITFMLVSGQIFSFDTEREGGRAKERGERVIERKEKLCRTKD